MKSLLTMLSIASRRSRGVILEFIFIIRINPLVTDVVYGLSEKVRTPRYVSNLRELLIDPFRHINLHPKL
jgi:hypothetical protein